MPRDFLALALAISLAAVTAAGCGGDDDGGTVDAAAVDAVVSVDAGPDATTATVCDTMCACAVANCTGFEMQTCLTECNGLPASVAACRLEHCGYAKSNPTFHCPHVEGDPDGAGTPAACIDN